MPEAMVQQVTSAEAFGKVAVLMGGQSAEREISLRSGSAVYQALVERDVDARKVDVGDDVLRVLAEGAYDRAFIILHGRGGEDGVMQGALEVLGLPFTGSGVLGSALAMDKLANKRFWLGAGVRTPGYEVLRGDSDFAAVIERLGGDVIVKPAHEGSSIGMARAADAQSLHAAFEAASVYDDCVFAERWIEGSEYTVAILHDEALPMIRLETPNEFYDFEAKYQSDSTRYLCPCGLDEEQEARLQAQALEAFRLAGASGWGRVDLMVDGQGEAWMIEINTVPGMTDHSLVPMAAKAAGMDFGELVWRILETAA